MRTCLGRDGSGWVRTCSSVFPVGVFAWRRQLSPDMRAGFAKCFHFRFGRTVETDALLELIPRGTRAGRVGKSGAFSGGCDGICKGIGTCGMYFDVQRPHGTASTEKTETDVALDRSVVLTTYEKSSSHPYAEFPPRIQTRLPRSLARVPRSLARVPRSLARSLARFLARFLARVLASKKLSHRLSIQIQLSSFSHHQHHQTH